MLTPTISPAPPGDSAALAPIYAAIVAGEHDAFLSALAGGDHHGFVAFRVAQEIPNGIRIKSLDQDDAKSLAEVCFEFNRLEMLRAAAASVWPEYADDTIRTRADRMNTLCTRYSYGTQAKINLAHVAAFDKEPHSVDFITLALEHGQESYTLDILSDEDPEAGALIATARMRVAIDAAPTPLAAPVPPRSRARQI